MNQTNFIWATASPTPNPTVAPDNFSASEHLCGKPFLYPGYPERSEYYLPTKVNATECAASAASVKASAWSMTNAAIVDPSVADWCYYYQALFNASEIDHLHDDDDVSDGKFYVTCDLQAENFGPGPTVAANNFSASEHLCEKPFLYPGFPTVAEYYFPSYMSANGCAASAAGVNASAWTMNNAAIANNPTIRDYCYYYLGPFNASDTDHLHNDDDVSDGDFYATCDLQTEYTAPPTESPTAPPTVNSTNAVAEFRKEWDASLRVQLGYLSSSALELTYLEVNQAFIDQVTAPPLDLCEAFPELRYLYVTGFALPTATEVPEWLVKCRHETRLDVFEVDVVLGGMSYTVSINREDEHACGCTSSA